MSITRYMLDLVGWTIVLGTLPLVAELTVLTFASSLPRRRSSSALPSSCLPTGPLAVIIPAHNEELLVARCIESLKIAAAGTDTRIFAIAHNCSDQTAKRASSAGAEVMLYNDPAARGKGFALLYGFRQAFQRNAQAVLVVDADSTVSENLIRSVCEALANGAEAVQCRYEMDSNSAQPKSRLTALAFRGFNFIRASGRERLGLSVGIQGNGFAIRKSVLTERPYNALSVVEDLEYHIQLVLAGKKVLFLEEALVSSALPYSKEAGATQRSRWEGGRASVARTWIAPLLGQVLRGRLRLLEPMLDLAALPIGYAAFLLLVGLCVPLEWLRIYSALAIAVIGTHVLAAAWVGPDFAGDLRIMFRAPGYILWKLRLLPRLLRASRKDAAWVATERVPAP